MWDNSIPMPGATALTRLKVYDTMGPDGQLSGTPHFHLVCSEMYFVLSGSGAVELIDARGFSRVELMPNATLVFTPGTLHRLVNPNGDLHLLIVMQNSGLPERGDTIATFKPAVLSDDLAFFKAMRAGTLDEAYIRRDAAVTGFLEVKDEFTRSHAEGRAMLETIYKLALARTSSKYKEWYECVVNGAFTDAQSSLTQILELGGKKLGHLFESQHRLIQGAETSTVGFCGNLNRYFDPGSLWPEGVRDSN